jgi:rSAM/selenodomain-associated transferase 1
MRPALAIFVKTPGLSPIKTRLAKDIGTAAAVEFHQLAAAAVASVVRECNSMVTPYWAVAESSAMGDEYWNGFPKLWQGNGGLGERLHSVYETLLDRHGSVVMIGADSPQMTSDLLSEVVVKLTCDPFVMGPAADGGFWLFGGCKALSPIVWRSIRYSQLTTASELLSALSATGNVACVQELTDVDTSSDLKSVVETISARARNTTEQWQLTTWLQGIRQQKT